MIIRGYTMDFKQKAVFIFQQQKKILMEYENLIIEYNENELLKENEILKKDLDDLKQAHKIMSRKMEQLKQENHKLISTLRERVTKENYVQKDFTESFSKNSLEKNKTYEKVPVVDYKSKMQKTSDESIKNLHNEKNKPAKNIPVVDKYNKKRLKDNDLEMKIGLNWINKIGIILILFGIGAVFQYTYSNFFNDHMKGISFFVLGWVFLLGGEWFYRKNKMIFSMGLIGGGIGILYISTFFSFFSLKIISMPIALVLALLITGATIILSLRYKSQTICSLGLIGGYLPFFSYLMNYGLDQQGCLIALGYLFILNVLILIISFREKWNVLNYISFILNIPCCIYLIVKVPFTVGVIYSFIVFSMYTVITLAYSFKYKLNIKASDIVLLALNTFVSSIVVYGLFKDNNLEELNGLLAFIFSLVHFIIGYFISIKLEEEKIAKLLYYITSLTFGIMFVPMHFGIQWATMGWIIESLLLIIFGYKYRKKIMEISGWVVYCLCMFSFFGVDLVEYMIEEIAFFHLRYLFIMASMIIILLMYLLDIENDRYNPVGVKKEIIKIYKYFVLINFYIYSVYNVLRVFNEYVDMDNKFYYGILLYALVTMMITYVYSKFRYINDKIVDYLNIILQIFVDLLCIFTNIFQSVIFQSKSTAGGIFSFILLVLYNIFVFLNIRGYILSCVNEYKKTSVFYPVFMSIYILFNSTLILFRQFEMEFNHFSFSILYMILGALCILYGFRKSIPIERRLGLGIALFSVVKLFIFDLSFLSTFNKIIAYFILGLILLLISFLYQQLKNSIEKNEQS